MEILRVEDLTFSYPKSDNHAINHINMSINEGDFNLFCGLSGSGKSTLLKLLKPEIAPFGELTGSIILDGKSILTMNQRESCERIGYINQRAESSIVTDTVWHELAFGMESLGYPTETIRSRVGEMVSFFGLEKWYHNNTWELSGGAKQMVCLASVLACSPDVLLLDEPTANLDPVASKDFFSMLNRINRELGTTVIIIEQELSNVYSLADRIFLFDEGTIKTSGTPEEVARYIYENGHPMMANLPAPTRLFFELGMSDEKKVWLSVSDGRQGIKPLIHKQAEHQISPENKEQSALSLKHCYFRYSKAGEEVIEDISLDIKNNCVTAIVGGNGSGKSTVLSLIAGMLKPYRGKVKKQGSVSYLPQDASLLFVHETVKEELNGCRDDIIELFDVSSFEQRHPLDLSGGEMERLALAKILSAKDEIILLDEPTSGMDGIAKNNLVKAIQMLKNEGKIIIFVSHDIEFIALAATKVVMLFDHNIISEGRMEHFFAGNHFYTTQVNRMLGKDNPYVITCEDVINLCQNQK